MKPDWDVVVCGGSCSGMRHAELLAKGGLRVLVLERRPERDPIARTWIVTPHLDRVLGFDPGLATLHRTGTMRMFAGTARCDVHLEDPDLVVERARILPRLIDNARNAGATLCFDTAVTNINVDHRGVLIHVRNNTTGDTRSIFARNLVGADGVRSTVARRMRARPQDAVPIVQAKVALPADWNPDVTAVWFEPEETRFFFWLIPEGHGQGALGVIGEQPSTARPVLDRFMQRNGFHALSYQGAMIPLHQPFRRIDWEIGQTRVLLIGDAAAHVKVTTVGGLVSGLWGAEAASRALLHGTPYWRELRGLHAELHVHDVIRWGLDRFDTGDYQNMLGLIGRGVQSLLGRHNRDTFAGAKWSLLAAQPRIIGLAAKVIFFS